MKKLFDKTRKNNKGFTLVELIIVIAVMAILTVVVAPQYLKYVEKSRVSTDENAISELKHIVEVTYIEAAVDNVTDTNVKIHIDSDGKFTYPNLGEELDSRVADIYPDEAYKFKSKTWKDQDVEFTVNPDTGIAGYNDPSGNGGNDPGNGGGGSGDPTQTCPDCGSTEHTVHPTCPDCGSTEHTVHPTCPDCGSTEHTVHPTCPDCGSTEHTVHPTCPDCGSKDHIVHPTCPDCGSKDHIVHPTCPDCGSTEHTVHPTCPDCGSKDHTEHPRWCSTHKGNKNQNTACDDPYCEWWDKTCGSWKHGENCPKYCAWWDTKCTNTNHSTKWCKKYCDTAWHNIQPKY